MISKSVATYFDNRAKASRAVSELLAAGIPPRAISLLERFEENASATNTSQAGSGRNSVAELAASGGIVGAILGVATLSVPVIGPLAAAGVVAASAVPTGIAIGAAVGATGGAIARLPHALGSKEAASFERQVRSAGIVVSVDADLAQPRANAAREILQRLGQSSPEHASYLRQA